MVTFRGREGVVIGTGHVGGFLGWLAKFCFVSCMVFAIVFIL